MTPPGRTSPEQQAREVIDGKLLEAGWVVQDRGEMNLVAGPGIAVREFVLASGYGFADYLLFVDGKAVGVLEAKPAGHTLSGVEPQVTRYAGGLPPGLNPPITPLPFLYLSTGTETTFANLLDPHPRSRRVFQFHRPETIREWLDAKPLAAWVQGWTPATQVADATVDTYRRRPSTSAAGCGSCRRSRSQTCGRTRCGVPPVPWTGERLRAQAAGWCLRS